MSDGGKGSAPRPLSVHWDKFESNWDSIFGSKHDKPEGKGIRPLGQARQDYDGTSTAHGDNPPASND